MEKSVQNKDAASEVDTDLMSRIIPILGTGNLKKLMGLKVLVSGISGLGAEIAKNLILTGVGSVTIHDTKKVTWGDLSSHVSVAAKFDHHLHTHNQRNTREESSLN